VRKQKKKTELEKQQQQLKLQSIQSQPNLQPAQQHAQPPLLNKAYTLQPRGINPLKAHTQTNPIDTLDSNNSANPAHEMANTSKLPFLVELNHDGFELQSPRVIQIKSDFYEIGNDKYLASTHPTNYIRLDPNIPGIEKKHCALKKSNDNLQLLLVPYHETYVNDRLIKDPTQLFNNFTIRLGKFALFRLENPNELNGFVVANNANAKQPAKPAANGSIPPNYGTLYDNGQVIDHPNAANTQSPQPMPRQTVQTPVPALNGPTTKPSEGLPGLLEFPDDGEDALLANICQTNQANWQFKLAPVYTMYMMLRYRLSQKYKSELSFNDKLHSSALLIHKMVNYMREAVDQNHSDKYILPYWLANSSELLYFLKQDTHLNQMSYDAQELLADCVQITFKYLVNIMQQQLDHVLGSFFDPSDHIEDVNLNMPGSESNSNENEAPSPDGISRPTLKQVIQVLNETMNLLRGSRVNAALTIQLFSQLFHYVSMWLFNRLVNDQRSGLCSRYWGDKLTRRLNKIQIWAEKQGLELAADCHLSRIIQAAFFLQTPKHDVQDLSTISSNCFALNSLQIRCLLKNYLQAPNEPPLSVPLCNNLISIAQNTADEVLKQEGRNLQLEEEVDLQLPFLLPEDGHSCEFIKGLPAGLLDFLENLQNSGHCWLWQNTQGPGSWKKFMSKELALQSSLTASQQNINMNPNPAAQAHQNVVAQTPSVNQAAGKAVPMANNEQQPKLVAQVSKQMSQPGPTVIKMRLSKKNNSLGLSIVAARGTNQINTGIYIKSVVPSGAADEDGRLSAGDQLLAVDDVSLINVTQERAAELMTKSGASVCLTIAKEAATYHDLDALLNKSPLPQAQSSITASMPALNNNNFIGQPQVVQSQPQHFMASTLPRNHQHHQNGYFNGNQPMNGSHLQQQMSQDLLCHDANGDGGYRARSMSQEVLKANNASNGLANGQQAWVIKNIKNI
jgi:afadin